MKIRRLFEGLTGVLGVTCLVVACDSHEVSSPEAPLSGALSQSALPESPIARSAVARAMSFRETAQVLVRDRARYIVKTGERQALADAQRVDMRIVGGRLVHLGSDFQTSFGIRASEPFEVRDDSSGIGAHVTMRGAREMSVAEHSGAFIVYRGGHALGDVLHRVTNRSSEDFLIMESAPTVASLSYDLALDGGATLRLVENTLELLDRNGSPRLRVAAPYLVDSTGARRSARLAVNGCAYDASPAAPWGRPGVNPGAASCEVRVTWDTASVVYPALLDPAWQPAGDMAVARSGAAITQLNTARVLVSGGFNAGILASSEIFDPWYGTWATTGSMAVARFSHTADAVASGSILAAGGTDGTNSFSSAELYDPAAGTWTTTGSMAGARDTHASVALPDGTVLVLGGSDSTGPLATAELYSGGSWSAAGSMSAGRQGLSATLRSDGTILAAGGYDSTATTATSDVWSSGAFSAGPALTTPRYGHTGTLLADGSVLLAGGRDATVILASETCASTCVASGSLTNGRAFHTATLMPDGRVLVAGGADVTTVLNSVELYSSGSFTADTSLTTAREGHVALLLPEGRAFVAGGDDGSNSLTSAEAWPQPTITATPGLNQVSVTWATTPGNRTDWIAIAPAGSSQTTYTKYVYTNGVASGSTTFTGIGQGSYVARVHLIDHYWTVAETAPFTISGATTAVTLDGSSVLVTPSSIVIDYANMSGSSTDWIGIFAPGAPSTSYIQYIYTHGALSGNATFSGLPQGQYVARAFFNNTYTSQAESAVFSITSSGPATTVSLDGTSTLNAPGNIIIDYTNMSGGQYDWIGIFYAGTSDYAYVGYVYTNGAINGSATFANVGAGRYVARAYFNNTYTKQAETPEFRVQ